MNALVERWSALSPRERLLVAVAGALAVLLLLMVAVIRPIAALGTSGQAAFDEAVATRSAVVRATGSGAPGGPVSSGPLRGIVSDTARQMGIVVDRYDIQQGAIDLTITDVAATELFAWLELLSSGEGIVVREGSVRPTGQDGTVTARLTLERRS